MAQPAQPTPIVSAVLFDLDGTLIATRRLYIEALSRALEPVLGTRLSEEEIMGHQPKAERRFLLRLAGPEHHTRVMADFYRAYEEHHPRAFQGVYPGVKPLLDELRRRKVPIGLVTGKSRRAWSVTEGHAGLGAFDAVILDDDVPRPKPDPFGVALALSRLGVEPARALYIGDSLTDLEAATAAGARPVGVLWSKKPHEVEAFVRDSLERRASVLREPAELLESGPFRIPARA